ncbi:TlpA disulfide reductase family protein [Corynebacterium sp. HS2168-gen11]|uniref:TlpA family protein disulfide reductase n=1 Tax=Corynebacterium sp. HS2168-gen11 TaxID=2974027 RepID=UPI00216AEF27|nr:TlpA disulfide reductase family protein [Corynebacterium sp. HS2168-gen11]MCS4535759.1 TlpA family protein disulfide reductase [Corynebacterium sp. HS2168-gen11]
MNTRMFLAAMTLVAATGISACSADDTAGTNAVAIGGTFQFHSPGGEKVIHYAEDERAPIANITGEAVVGQPISLDDYAGHVVVLNAWGQWCGPCRTEVDDLETVHEALSATGGAVIGINVRDTKSLAADFMVDNGLTYPSLFDPPFKTAALLGGLPASVVPTTIVLDKQHRPAVVFLRAITDTELLPIVQELEAQ